MNGMFIVLLAVLAQALCAVICIKEIYKDLAEPTRNLIKRIKLTLWASRVLKNGRKRREQLPIIPFNIPENGPESSCEQRPLPSRKSNMIPFNKQAM